MAGRNTLLRDNTAAGIFNRNNRKFTPGASRGIPSQSNGAAPQARQGLGGGVPSGTGMTPGTMMSSAPASAAESGAFNERNKNRALYGKYGKGGLEREAMANRKAIAAAKDTSFDKRTKAEATSKDYRTGREFKASQNKTGMEREYRKNDLGLKKQEYESQYKGGYDGKGNWQEGTAITAKKIAGVNARAALNKSLKPEVNSNTYLKPNMQGEGVATTVTGPNGIPKVYDTTPNSAVPSQAGVPTKMQPVNKRKKDGTVEDNNLEWDAWRRKR